MNRRKSTYYVPTCLREREELIMKFGFYQSKKEDQEDDDIGSVNRDSNHK